MLWLVALNALGVPAEVSTLRDVPYGVLTEQKLDLYLPQGRPRFPVLMFIYGGAWTTGSKALYGAFATSLAAQGIGVAIPNYRLSPQVRHPAHVEDVAAAFAWVHANIARHGGDPQSLFVAGHSAGGHLAALLALDQSYLARHNLTSRNIAGAIPMSGVYTLEVPVVSRRMIERAFGADPAAAAAASPSSHARASAPPFLLLAAARDTPALRRDGQQMAGALRAKGNHDVTFEVIPGRNHFTLISQMKDPGDAAMQKLVAFVRWLSRG